MSSTRLRGKSAILGTGTLLLCALLLLAPARILADVSQGNQRPTESFSELLKQLKSVSILEERNALFETALASGRLSRDEVGFVYAIKGATYFEMAIRQSQQMKQEETWSRRGELEVEAGLHISLQHYNTAIAIQPDVHIHYWNRGFIHELLENDGEALADYTRTIELEPRFVGAYRYRAGVLKRMGEDVRAAADLEKAAALAAGN